MNHFSLLLAQAQGASPPQQNLMSTLSMMAIIFLIFYLLLIRPQRKQMKEHQDMLKALRKGDEIVTSGGIYGRIVEVGERILTVEIADKVRIKINREGIAGRVTGQKDKEKSSADSKA